jgi:hypothetical protein
MGMLHTVKLVKYADRNLWKMTRVLDAAQSTMNPEATKAILSMLRAYLMVRPQVQTEKPNGRRCIMLAWKSRELRRVPLRMIMTQPKIIAHLPPEVRPQVEDVRVVRRLIPPIGKLIFNYSKVARDLQRDDLNEADCPCRQLFDERFRPEQGCVLTGDVNIVRLCGLRQLLMYGPRFRVRMDAEPMAALSSALDEFIARLSAGLAVDKAMFAIWRRKVLAACQTRIRSHSIASRGAKHHVLSGKMQKYLRFLHKHLVLVPVDKASNNVAFVCRRKYVEALQTELSSTGEASGDAYVSAVESVTDIVGRHKRELSKCHLFDSDKLAYLYWLPKMHKRPVSQRFIAGSASCTTTSLSKVLSDVLNFVLRALRARDDDHIGRTGVRRFFVVNGYEDVADFLARWQRSPDTAFHHTRHLHTGDFSTMYTTIPHDDLIRCLKLALKEAWTWGAELTKVDVKEVAIQCGGGDVKWVRTRALCAANGYHSKSSHRLNLDGLISLVSFLVSNTYLVNGGQLRRQAVGIPMGTNCAPPIANLYLYAYESSFIDKLMAHCLAEARGFHMTFRLIDDVLSVDNIHWVKYRSLSAEEGGIYPRALTLNDTNVSVREVHFLGMSISSNAGALRLNVFDKRKEFPFRVRRYPHMQSMIPTSIPYGVFVGQLHRYYRICTTWRDFVKHAQLLAETLVRQGCRWRRLQEKYRSFIALRGRTLRWGVRSVLISHALRATRGAVSQPG